MPTIAEAAAQLATDAVPVLFLDTCILLDVIRVPLRKISGCVRGAVALSELQAKTACRLVASSMIQREWDTYEQLVAEEVDRHLSERDLDAVAFHEACGLVNLPLSFSSPSYQSAGLVARLRDLSRNLLQNAIHLSPSDETTAKATNRTLECRRPAKKGGGLQDCIIIEEYFELSRLLQNTGFPRKKTFCSSNSRDYQDGQKLHDSLVVEFDSVELVFTNALHWAVNELSKT